LREGEGERERREIERRRGIERRRERSAAMEINFTLVLFF